MSAENAEVKSACFNCSNNITHPRELIGESIACPHCGQETLLRGNAATAPAPAPAPVKQPAAPASPAAKAAPAKSAPIPPMPDGSEPPQAFIERVRAKTCYRTLRRIIYFVTSLMFALSVLSLLPLIGVFLGPNPGFGSLLMLIVVSVAVSALWAVTGFAFRELAGLLLDIADVLIEQNRRK